MPVQEYAQKARHNLASQTQSLVHLTEHANLGAPRRPSLILRDCLSCQVSESGAEPLNA